MPLNIFYDNDVFQLEKALYVGDVESKDVTQIVYNTLLARKHLKVSNALFGDIEVGAKKRLIINDVDIYQENEFFYLGTPKDNLAILYTNNIAYENILNNVIKQIHKISNDRVDVVTCSWYDIPNNPFVNIKSIYQKSHHLTISIQILQCLLFAKERNNYKYVSFLEHDTLYPDDYLLLPDEDVDVWCNMNYMGMNSKGFQKLKYHHQPMHQISMKFDLAIEHFQKLVMKSISGKDILVEPNDYGITNRYTLNPSVHINTDKFFTSHYICYNEAYSNFHDYWGYSNSYF